MFSQFIIKQVVTFVEIKISMKLKIILLTISTLFFLGNTAVLSQSQQNDNEKIVSMIKKKRNYNKRNGYGFRIQLYNGNERTARSVKGGFQVRFPATRTYLSYKSPEWKIQVGNYKTRLQADKALLVFQLKYVGAIVVPLSNK